MLARAPLQATHVIIYVWFWQVTMSPSVWFSSSEKILVINVRFYLFFNSCSLTDFRFSVMWCHLLMHLAILAALFRAAWVSYNIEAASVVSHSTTAYSTISQHKLVYARSLACLRTIRAGCQTDRSVLVTGSSISGLA